MSVVTGSKKFLILDCLYFPEKSIVLSMTFDFSVPNETSYITMCSYDVLNLCTYIVICLNYPMRYLQCANGSRKYESLGPLMMTYEVIILTSGQNPLILWRHILFTYFKSEARLNFKLELT